MKIEISYATYCQLEIIKSKLETFYQMEDEKNNFDLTITYLIYHQTKEIDEGPNTIINDIKA